MVVAAENFSRSNVERRLEMKRFDGKRWIAAGLAGMIAAAMSITSFAENRWKILTGSICRAAASRRDPDSCSGRSVGVELLLSFFDAVLVKKE